MSDEPRRRPRGRSVPTVVWGLLGLLTIALFVLAMGLLGRPGV
jgi:hypothetical protein